MENKELNPNIQLNSFYYSESLNWFVFVVVIRNDWVYYKHPNSSDDYFQHMIIDEFYEKFKKVAFIQNENS